MGSVPPAATALNFLNECSKGTLKLLLASIYYSMELCLRHQQSPTQSRHSVPLVKPGGLLLCLCGHTQECLNHH